MDSTMMKFLSLMTAASVAETESKDKMKGKIPKYPATAEPLDEGSSTVWMKWEPDFKTYANINNLAPHEELIDINEQCGFKVMRCHLCVMDMLMGSSANQVGGNN